ncbi:hypothetical protein RRG08_036837 [Elysia crispata]|uniref:Uncharacterized protein n=1 Tax=Elysia crispata TaxID=231223 RepID=A0AAE0Y7M5_9GAST|nr:hypothetical protein RRG08_036837 [Elysia crispata]
MYCQDGFFNVLDQTSDMNRLCSAAEDYVTCINNLTGLPRESYKGVYLGQLKIWMRRLKLTCDIKGLPDL